MLVTIEYHASLHALYHTTDGCSYWMMIYTQRLTHSLSLSIAIKANIFEKMFLCSYAKRLKNT